MKNTSRSPYPVSVALTTKVLLQLAQTESGTYSHQQFEENYLTLESNYRKTIHVLLLAQSLLKCQYQDAVPETLPEED